MSEKASKLILSIDPKGLTYIDENQEKKYIDFEECHKNYVLDKTHSSRLDKLKALNNLSDEDVIQVVENIKNSKQVAVRFGNFFEFYTQPKVQIEFYDREEYVAVLIAIAEAGWLTFDLT